jgi:hypothetical protein
MTTPTKPNNNPIWQAIFAWSPRRVFLTDALGALLTTALLAGVLVPLRAYLGLDAATLYGLAALVSLLFVYSLTIFWVRPRRWVPFLRGIALANASYCFITLSILALRHAAITPLGYVYFIGEALLIAAIAWTEWTYATRFTDRAFTPHP